MCCCGFGQHLGSAKLPFPPLGTEDMVMAGRWEVSETGEPLWVWQYQSGWQDYLTATQVATDSTNVVGFTKEFVMTHVQEKVLLIHRRLGLEEPSLVELRRKLTVWYDEQVPQLQCLFEQCFAHQSIHR